MKLQKELIKRIVFGIYWKGPTFSAMVDKDSTYPRIESRFLVTADEEQDFVEKSENRTFTQFKDQAPIVLGVR